jgi:hypothetical protein
MVVVCWPYTCAKNSNNIATDNIFIPCLNITSFKYGVEHICVFFAIAIASLLYIRCPVHGCNAEERYANWSVQAPISNQILPFVLGFQQKGFIITPGHPKKIRRPSKATQRHLEKPAGLYMNIKKN